MSEKEWIEKDSEIHGDTGEVAVGRYFTDADISDLSFPRCKICGEPFTRSDDVAELREKYVLDRVGSHYPKDKHVAFVHKECRNELLGDENV